MDSVIKKWNQKNTSGSTRRALRAIQLTLLIIVEHGKGSVDLIGTLQAPVEPIPNVMPSRYEFLSNNSTQCFR
jgi:hypothetical protein